MEWWNSIEIKVDASLPPGTVKLISGDSVVTIVNIGVNNVKQLEVPDHLVPALERMIATLTKKKADYAGEDAWANFRATSEHFGLALYEAADFNEVQKLSRLRTLRRTGREPQNEAIEDTYLDKANFALLAYAMYLEGHTAEPAVKLSKAEPVYPPHTNFPPQQTPGIMRKCCPTVYDSTHSESCATQA